MKKRILLFSILTAILLTIPLLSACGEEVTTTATDTATATATTAAKPEGTLTFGASSLEAQGYLPWRTFISSYLLQGNVYDSLAYDTASGRRIPSLAYAWEWNDDYTTLTIHLHEGVQFQDGWGELTSADVKYMLEQSMSEGSTSGAVSFMDIITSIETPDDYTVVVHQSESNFNNAEVYAFHPVYGCVPCKAYIDSVGEEEANINPIGSGPYKLIEYRTSDYVKYEAADEHWRVVPEFKYLIIKAVPEESTRVAMLKTGDIDCTSISASSIADLQGEEFTIDYWTFGPNTAILFGGLCRPGNPLYEEGYHNQDPWADIRVREAMNIAIDRDAINESLHLGTARPMTLVHQIPGWEDLTPIPYDPERARQLLAEAAADGVFTPDENGGFHFTLVSAPSHPGTPLIAKEAEAVAGYWADIGITVDIAPIDFPSYNEKVVALQNAGECFTYRLTYISSNPIQYLMQLNDEDPHWGTKFQCEASDILTPMAQEALAEADSEKRDDTYREIAQVEYDSWVSIPLIQLPYIVAKNNEKVGEWPADVSGFYWSFCYIRHAEPLNTFHLFEITD
jgi:peptide/nickel transport system substrate-binding protein